MSSLKQTDPQIYDALECEKTRQRETINLIASENYTSKAVIEAQGSFLTNKYAEGYPGRRYYGGCENMDTVESLAIDRAQELFRAEHVNVQSHSGAQANMAAYFALIQYNDTVLAMSLAHGGHLTHGDPVNASGKSYNFVGYGVSADTGRIDYNEVERLAKECQPKLIVAGASAYPRVIDFEKFRYIADQVGALMMVDMAHIAGLIAAGVHPSPVPYSDIVTSTTHKTLRGPRGGFILCKNEYAKAIDSAVFPGMQGGPLMHSISAKAVAFREALQPEFVEYQKSTVNNARVLGEELRKLGFVLISEGTDNHMVLVDLTSKEITGRKAEACLGRAGIVISRSKIPFDPLPGYVTSGMRLGTPASTSRGFGESEMKTIAALVNEVIDNPGDAEVENRISREVKELCSQFPVPGIDR